MSPVRSELDQVRAATAKYQDLDVATRDGYKVAHIVTQGMGHHYLNPSLVDERFEPNQPEILVYEPDRSGKMRLVAVEYAAPLDKLSHPPQGFTGSNDVWEHNVKYGLWTLHAWVWKRNAAGDFAPMNHAVRLDPATLEDLVARHDMK